MLTLLSAVTRCSWSRGTNGQKKQRLGPKERRGPVKIICASVLYLNFWGVPVQFGWLSFTQKGWCTIS